MVTGGGVLLATASLTCWALCASTFCVMTLVGLESASGTFAAHCGWTIATMPELSTGCTGCTSSTSAAICAFAQ